MEQSARAWCPIGHDLSPSVITRAPYQKLSATKVIASGLLERSLADTGDLALVGQFPEADTADAIVTQIGVRAAADLAAVVVASGELGFKMGIE